MKRLGECPMTTFSSCNNMFIQHIKGGNLLMMSFTSQSTRLKIVSKITRFISKLLPKTEGHFKASPWSTLIITSAIGAPNVSVLPVMPGTGTFYISLI